jgi:hypothetical protein
VAPRFEDPPAEENLAPVIISSRPPQGMIGTALTFEITVTDPNLDDDLWVRWIGEYPPYSDTDTRRLTDDRIFARSAGGDPLVNASITIDCFSPLAQLPQHRIMALVSDRAFFDDNDATLSLETRLTGIRPGAQKAEAHWVLINLQCQ